MRTGVSNHPEKTVLAHLTDSVRRGGVIKLTGNNFAVSESNPTALTVDVAAGRAYLKSTSSNAYPVISDAIETLMIESNATSNSRIDTVVLYIDLSAVPDSENEGKGIAKLTIIKGTPAAAPVAATESEIETSLGAGIPFQKLAEVTVAAGAAAILNENIVDVRVRAYLKTPRQVIKLNDVTSVAFDANASDQFEIVATADCTINAPANMETGDWLVFSFVQDEIGNHNLSFANTLLTMNSDLTPNNLPGKATTYIIEKTQVGFRLYLGGRQE